jgi:CBS domain-containing protein
MELAAGLMWDRDIGFLVVLDDQNRLAGVLTDRDICMAAYTGGKALRSIPVRVAMARNVFTVAASEDVAAAEQIMDAHQVRRLPMIDGKGRIIGVVSLNDIAREARNEISRRHPDVDSAGLARTLARICEPRRPMILCVR